VRAHRGGQGGHVVAAPVDGETAVAAVESGEAVGPEAHDRHAQRFQHLERARKVEHGLGPGADHGHRMAGQRAQVAGDVARPLDLAMDAADASRGHHGDPRRVRGGDGGRDRRRAGAAAREPEREVGAVERRARFLRRRREADLVVHHDVERASRRVAGEVREVQLGDARRCGKACELVAREPDA
jgi:hypothetical protein